LRESRFDGPRIPEVERLCLLDCDSKKYDGLGIAMIEKRDQTCFQLDTRIVVEIEENEKTVRSRVQGSAIRPKLRRELVQKPFMPWIRYAGRLAGEPALAPMWDDLKRETGQESGEPASQECFLGGAFHQNV
jgi:hypothetical protein